MGAGVEGALGEGEEGVAEPLLVPPVEEPGPAGEGVLDELGVAWPEACSGGGARGGGAGKVDTCAEEAPVNIIHIPSKLIRVSFLILRLKLVPVPGRYQILVKA
jgi:hypothetical protein